MFFETLPAWPIRTNVRLLVTAESESATSEVFGLIYEFLRVPTIIVRLFRAITPGYLVLLGFLPALKPF